MIAVRLAGALLVICGVVYLARAAIYHGGMSDPEDPAGGTLEPRQGDGFAGFEANWPGLAMLAGGALLLLLPSIL